MKISKSKQELARIISENGGWRDGAEFSVQNGEHGRISFSTSKPVRHDQKSWMAKGGFQFKIEACKPLPNWHQTILSREEYLHLYPAPIFKHRLCESVMPSIPEPEINSKNINITQVDDIDVVESKPTIEQLAAEYRNAKDYAERKQDEADAAKADANEALRKLEIAGEAIGLLLSPINAKKEPELVIAVQVGDEVECIKSNVNPGKYMGMVGRLRTIDESDTSTPYLVDFGGEANIWCHEVKFIRRP